MDIDVKDRPINIKDISISYPPLRENNFDPEEYMNNNVWEYIKRKTDEDRESMFISGVSGIIGPLALGFPATFAKLEFGNDIAEMIKNRLETDVDNPRLIWTASVGLALAAKACFPTQIAPEKYQFLDELIDIEPYLSDPQGLAELVNYRSLLFPRNPTSESIYTILQTKANSLRSAGHWGDFISIAAAMKLLQPEKQKEMDLNQEVWQSMVDELNLVMTRQKLDFLWYGMCLRILASDKVKVTEDKIEIIMKTPKSDLEPKVVLPTTRKF